MQGVVRGWRAFGRWRWTRPFWGGLLLILAGLELFATTQGGADLNGLSVHVGPSGYLSWLLPAVLVTCGLLIWFSAGQRVFYSVIGAVTSVFSLMAVNLGGFFIGLLLGAIGSVLAFGWTPPPAESADDEPSDDEPSDDEPAAEELTGPKAEGDGGPAPSTGQLIRPGTVEEQDQILPRGYDESGAIPPGDGDGRARRTPMAVWIVILVLILGAGLGALPGAGAALAQPCPPASPSPSVTASRSPGPIEGIIGEITGGIGDLLGISPSPGTAASPAPSPPASGGSCGADPDPGGSAEPGTPGDPNNPGDPSDPAKPGDPAAPSDPAKPGKPADQVKQLGIPAGVPPVAMRPSLLTGTKVEMWDLGLDGIVDMPRADGSTIKALQFSMTRADTHDFRLDTPRHQELSPITSAKLGVQGHVRFYATRFTGTLLGIPLTLTPESPLPPDGIPIALPYIAFDDPSMELLLATCDVLTGPDLVDRV
ncbi:DUF6114 domain-containing protein [Catenuloplanes japonicus]|uniref:DUF6114 domain-containing protein n=1 Tax=Catenuloplanes japonicus TaxID=33876 RepID=UPI0005254D87|nr:DUF6114 domain-containing protein [Catenuloplanes japonicus]